MADLKISQLTGATTPLAGTEVVPVVQSNTTKKVSIANLTAGRSVGMQQANIAAAAGGSFGNPAWVADDGTGAMRLIFLAAPYAGVPAGKPWLHSYQDIYIGSDAGITVNFVSGGTTVSFDSGNLKPAAAKGVNFTANTPAAGMTSQLLNWYEEGTWTPVVTGFSADPASMAGRYTRIGRAVTVQIYMPNAGTSNAIGFTVSLPFTSAFTFQGFVGQATNNSAATTCVGYLTATNSTLTLYEGTGNNWAASNGKAANISFTYFTS